MITNLKPPGMISISEVEEIQKEPVPPPKELAT
jgi:hypothetical protein